MEIVTKPVPDKKCRARRSGYASTKRVEKFGWYLAKRTDEYPEIAGIGFAPVKAVTTLQGADMIAYETYLYGVNWLVTLEAPR